MKGYMAYNIYKESLKSVDYDINNRKSKRPANNIDAGRKSGSSNRIC